MLLLERKVEERVYLEYPGGRIEVLLLGVRGKRARLGITAPREVRIRRGGSRTGSILATTTAVRAATRSRPRWPRQNI